MALWRRLSGLLGWLLLGTVLLLVVAGLAGVDIRLDPLRPAIEQAAGKALERPVSVHGPVRLTAGFWPSISVEDVSIANPPGWPADDQVSLRRVHGQIGLPPLLSGELVIPSLEADGVQIHFVRNTSGQSNFSRTAGENRTAPESPVIPEDTGEAPRQSTTRIELSEVDSLTLRDIVIDYRDPQGRLQFTLDKLSGRAPRDEPIQVSLNGKLQDTSYAFEIHSASLQELLDRQRAWDITLEGTAGRSTVRGSGSLNPEKTPRESALQLEIAPLDVGALLSHGIVEDLRAKAGTVTLDIRLTGDDPGQLLELSHFEAQIRDGLWTLNDPHTGDFLDVHIQSGEVSVRPDNPVGIQLTGSIDTVPARIAIHTSDLATLVRTRTHLPLRLEVDTSGMALALSGHVDLPVSSASLHLQLSASGDRLDALDRLLDTSLPPWGPYAFEGAFAMDAEGYRIDNLAIHVADSDLHGEISLTTAGVRPRMDIRLATQSLQLNDFDTGDWSAFEDRVETGNEAGMSRNGVGSERTREAWLGRDRQQLRESGFRLDADRVLPASGPQGKEQIVVQRADARRLQEKQDAEVDNTREALLGHDTLSSLDADFSLEVDEVISGNDRLGKGQLVARLRDARLAVDPLSVEVPGGGLKSSFSFEPSPTGVSIGLKAHIDKLDYGYLARRAVPDSDMGGLFSLDTELSATAPSWKEVMASANGHFDLAIWPLSFQAGVIDLWAVNIIAASAAEMDKEKQSVINCIVGRFDIHDGVLAQDAVVMDTSRLRVWGETQIDFRDESLKLKLRPVAKKPEYFSLATPVTIKGSINDFELKIPRGALIGTGLKFITSPIHASVRRLLREDRLPKQGEDVCLGAMDRSVELAQPAPRVTVDEEMEPWN